MTDWATNATETTALEQDPDRNEAHLPEPGPGPTRPRRHPANVAMAVVSVALAMIVVGAVFSLVGARHARSEYRSDAAARLRTTKVVETRSHAALDRAETLRARTQAVIDAYVALDDALDANVEAQRAFADAVNAAVDHYNAGDEAGSYAAFEGDVRTKLDELTRRTAAAVAAQQVAKQAEQALQEVAQ